ncbi:MAG: hypothetical protein OEZ47_16430 [Gammaproteobacteria bacterium]|nr:hypothetical protein [Gammaproteobacteria bacterium]
MNNLRQLGVLLFFLVLIATQVKAGVLDDFEKDSTTSSRSDRSESTDSSRNQCRTVRCEKEKSLASQFFGWLFGDVIVGGLIKGTGQILTNGTKVTLNKTSKHSKMRGISVREAGSPLLPTAKLSGNWQSVFPDLEGRDLELELGYSLVGLHVRKTRFLEHSPEDSLSLVFNHVMYRLSFGNNFTLGLGVGQSRLSGNEQNSGTSITLPYVWHFGKNIYLDAWNSFTSFNDVPVTDLDYSLMYSKNGLSASLGYRSVSNPVSSLSGPYVGLSFIY